MKLYFVVILVVINCSLYSQSKGVSPLSTNNQQPPTKNTYAVVIGISDYQDKAIPDLRFATRDAEAFANFLRSKAGGSLDGDHLKVLTNEYATAGNVSSYLYWLVEECREGDQAIIYFSGHGDVEAKFRGQPGFLLCWDAPSRVYMAGGTVQLGLLQTVISTLSLDTKAKVTVIADACRSGKLAGSENNGSQLTNANLSQQYANEIKILSCQPNEFSIEGEQWGGGRGAFSYNLVDALYGLADGNGDLFVTLHELDRYLEDHVTAEVAPVSQVPMILGMRSEILARVDASLLAAIKSGKSNQQTLLSSIDTKGMEDDVLARVDTSISRTYKLFNQALKNKIFLEPAQACAEHYYQKLIKESGLIRLHPTMTRNYAAALQDEAQQAINNYLQTDQKELELRWKYDPKYENYPAYLQKAAELLGPHHYTYKAIKAREYYYTGLNLRLKGEQKNDTNFFKSAKIELMKSLEYESNSSYVLNELGYINKKSKNYSQAIEYFNNATLQSPKWLLPRINLMNTYNRLGELDKALQCGKKMYADYPDSYLLHFNLGVVYTNLKEWTLAEEEINKALFIQKDDRDALFNLSFVLYNEKKYDEVELIINTLLHLYPEYKELCIPMACIKLKKGQESEAFNIIEKALQNGFKNFEALESEADLMSLIRTEKYQSMKKKYTLK
ncbi:MAG: caspase family protein [Saprospiraceae bacterium]|nr:caspase family protein [Saprospiraceae bacterium]